MKTRGPTRIKVILVSQPKHQTITTLCNIKAKALRITSRTSNSDECPKMKLTERNEEKTMGTD